MAKNNKSLIEDGQIIILKIEGENYNQVVAEILKTTLPEYSKCIYVSINKPYSFLSRFFPKNQVDSSKITVIDCISEIMSLKEKAVKNLIVCEGPSNFTQISIAIEEAAKSISTSKLLILDSISTLLIYSSEKNVAKFLEFLISRLRSLNVTGILFGIDEESLKRIEKFISPSCDWIGTYDNYSQKHG